MTEIDRLFFQNVLSQRTGIKANQVKMPVKTVSTQNLNDCDKRSQSVDRIIKTFSESFQSVHECETLQYNLIENAKRIESAVFEVAKSETEYSRLIAEKIEDIQNKLNKKNQEMKETVESQTATFRDSQGWRFFFSPELRRAVVNAFIEDVTKKVKVPIRYKFGLRIGVEQIENFAFKAAATKVDYFRILDRKKVEITSELNAYFIQGGE